MRSLLLLLALPTLAFAQGQLTPPAEAIDRTGPVPTMKTLTQVEPRTPLEAGAPGVSSDMNGGLIISRPGSYYLTADLTVASGNGITLDTSEVTLDLNGFTIASTAGANVVRGCGIQIPGTVANVAVRNGRILGGTTNTGGQWTAGGFDYGIRSTSGTTGIQVSDLAVSGIVQTGIALEGGSLARNCSAHLCGITGISAQVVCDSVAENCGLLGIAAKTASRCSAQGTFSGLTAEIASDCRGSSTSMGTGLSASLSAINCVGIGVSSNGLQVGGEAGGTATNCYGASTYGIGLSVSGTATNCHGESNAMTGLFARSALNCSGRSASGPGVDANDAVNCSGVSGTGIGLQVENTASGCYGSSNGGTHGARIRGTAQNCRGLIYAGTGIALEANTASNCVGDSINGAAVSAQTTDNCHGKATGSGAGVIATVATSSFGESSSGIGLQATQSATGCSGSTASGSYGLVAGNASIHTGSAENCRGQAGSDGKGLGALTASNCLGQSNTASNCLGQSNTGLGIFADTATNSRGQSQTGAGLMAQTATNCYGLSTEGSWGMYIFGTANSCRGKSGATGGTAIWATIAVACTSEGGVITGNKQLGTP